MSRKSSRRQRLAKPEQIAKFKRFGFRSYFLWTLALLLAIGLIWYASRGPSASSYLNLGDGLEVTLETISKSNSNRQLKQLSDEAFELFPSLSPEEKLSAWQVLAAIAGRRQVIAKDEPQRLQAVHDELVARQSIVNLSQSAPAQRLQSLSRLEQSARPYLSQNDPAVARQAISSMILVTSLRYDQSPKGSEPLAEVLSLLRSIEGKFVPDASLIQVLEICLEAFSQKETPEAAEQIAIELETRFGNSPDSALAQWANLVREKQWLRSRQVVEQLSLASTGNTGSFSIIKQTAIDLLQHNPSDRGPSSFGVQRTLELAQFLENLNHPADAREVHEAIQSLSRSRVPSGELEQFKSHSRQALNRIGLLGRQIQLPPAFDNATPTEMPLVVVQFVGAHSPAQDIKAGLIGLARFNDRGCRTFVASPELSNEALVAAFGELSPGVKLLSQEEAKKLAEQCFLPPAPFVVVYDEGKLVLTGLPLDRMKPWLENRLLK